MKPIRIGSASRIEIGYDGENGARAVVFDATKWMEEMPGCTAEITAQRADGKEYIAPDVTQDEAERTITWTLTSAETMEGEGRAQLLWMDGERIAKQAIFTTVCHESLKSDATQIGVPEPVWAQQSLAAAQEARKSAEAAKVSEIGAQNALEETKGVLDAATGNIEDVRKRADAAQTKAEKNEMDIGQLKADMNGKMDLGDWEKGFVSETGVETSNNYTWRTGKIPVSPLAPYKIVVVNHNGYIIRKFNASDEIIGSVSQTGSTSTETIEKTIWLNDDGISYIRMCVTSQDNTNYPANGENVSLFLSVNEQYCRNYGEVTPEMFGAVGDGVTNDTTALQACIDYAALNGVSVKSVKGRKYKVTQITINKPVDIDLGWATIVSGSASSTVIVNRTTNAAYGNTRVNGTLRRVIFDGNLVSNGILYVSNDIRGVYEDLIIQNMGEKVSSSGRTDEDKGTENLSRGIVYAAKPGKGGGNYFRRIYGQMQPNYGSYDTLLIDVMGSDSTFQNIDYQHIKYGIRITGGAFVDNFHGYITSRSIYPGSYCMRVGKNGFVIASQYYPDTQQYGTIVNNDGKPVIINGGMSYFSPDSEIATSGAVSEYPPYLFYGANSDQLTGVNVCGMHFNAPEGINGEPYTYTLCNVDTQMKIINAVYNNIIGQKKDDVGQLKDDVTALHNQADALFALCLDGTPSTYKAVMKSFFLTNGAADATPAELTALCDRWYTATRTGWDGGVKFYAPDVSAVSDGEKIGNNAGLTCTPSTNTVAGQDDYAGLPLFACVDVNWIVDPDTLEPVITAIDGITDSFDRYDPEKFVGVMQMSGYRWWNDGDTNYYLRGYCDSLKPYANIEPLAEAVRASDNSVRPWVIHAKYMAKVESGKFTCYSGVIPTAYSVSHNTSHTYASAVGPQYSGGTAADNAWIKLMSMIKYGTMTQDGVNQGCVQYNFQYPAAVSESGVQRVIVTKDQAANLIVGSSVIIGNYVGSLDRGNSGMYSITGQAGAVITSIQEVTIDGNTYAAVNVDCAAFDTVANGASTTGTTHISTWYWRSGTCDNVLGNDGSPDSPGSGKYPAMIQGIEYSVGGYEVYADVILNLYKDSSNVYWYEPYLVNRSAQQSTGITSNYKATGLKCQQPDANAWLYIKKEGYAKGIYFPVLVRGSSSTYHRDGFYMNAASVGTREWLAFGVLFYGSDLGGLSLLNGSTGLSGVGWYVLARLSPNGNRGEWAA